MFEIIMRVAHCFSLLFYFSHPKILTGKDLYSSVFNLATLLFPVVS